MMTRSTLLALSTITLLACGPVTHGNDGGDAGDMDAGPDETDAGPDGGPRPDAGPDAGPGSEIGQPCARDEDCASGICFPAGFGTGICTEACADPTQCPSGWGCEDFGGTDVCQCEASAESCNGVDDDCDGVVDEGRAESIGCADGQICTAGACECPAARACGADCVDTEFDPRHCGECDNACGAGEVCNGGDCCLVGPETCNGVDDDCDGAVDEAFGAQVGCGTAEACVDGSCECPADRMCGDGCTDTLSDRAHCGECDNACPGDEECVDGMCCDATGARVDLLLVVDNSGSMLQEQASLIGQLPALVRVLATGDLDQDGIAESEPVRDLNIGVISTDMGTGGFLDQFCTAGRFGDDGILNTQGADTPGCMATYPSFLNFDPSSGGDPDAFANDAACVATLGTAGCGIEQPLEAVLKAVTPSTSPLRFFDDTRGHADVANAGFLRPDSILVTLVLTDENDCSAADPELFDMDSSTYPGPLNLRCFDHPSALHPLSRYVDGLLATRADPRDLIFAQIVGIPVGLEDPGAPPNYASLLAAPELEEVVDTSTNDSLLPSCNVPGRGLAFPPRRLLRAGQALQDRGVTTVVGSICQESYSAPMFDVLSAVVNRLRESCAENQ